MYLNFEMKNLYGIQIKLKFALKQFPPMLYLIFPLILEYSETIIIYLYKYTNMQITYQCVPELDKLKSRHIIAPCANDHHWLRFLSSTKELILSWPKKEKKNIVFNNISPLIEHKIKIKSTYIMCQLASSRLEFKNQVELDFKLCIIWYNYLHIMYNDSIQLT